MAEVPGPGQQHRGPGGIDGGHRIGVVQGAARLDERRHAGLQADLDRVRERVERVRRAGGARPRLGPLKAIAFATAPRAASTRDVWPDPIPISRPCRTSTIAFEVTPRTRRQARSRSARSASVGLRRLATVQVAGSSGRVSGAVTRTAPPAVRIEPVGSGGPRTARHPSRDRPRAAGSAWWRGSRAPRASKPGATTTSRKIVDQRLGHDRVHGRVSATTPPYADTGSPARAARHASRSDDRSAAPHGLVCLTITQAGPRSARPIDAAEAASRTLLYDSALPWSGGAPVANGPSSSAAPRAPVAGRRLVRVLAVAERLDLLERDRQAGRIRVGGARQAGLVREVDAGRRHPLGQYLGDPRVVGGGVAERLDRQRGAQPDADPAVRPELRQHGVVAIGRGHDRRPRHGSWPPPGPSTGRRCRSPRPARRNRSRAARPPPRTDRD